MKARPVALVNGHYVETSVEEATHVVIELRGPVERVTLPIQRKGSREHTGNWSWNGDTELPTLKPSVLCSTNDYRCHTWITDGKATYLDDCSHEFRNTIQDLVDL